MTRPRWPANGASSSSIVRRRRRSGALPRPARAGSAWRGRTTRRRGAGQSSTKPGANSLPSQKSRSWRLGCSSLDMRPRGCRAPAQQPGLAQTLEAGTETRHHQPSRRRLLRCRCGNQQQSAPPCTFSREPPICRHYSGTGHLKWRPSPQRARGSRSSPSGCSRSATLPRHRRRAGRTPGAPIRPWCALVLRR
jgi:hypothetical protein